MGRMPPAHVGGIVGAMSITTRTSTGPGREARGIRTRLSPRARKLALLVHIASAGSWLGLDLVLGLNHGLTRFWWVLAKLVLNVVLVALVFVLLWPGVVSVGEVGRTALDAGTSPEVRWNLLFPPVVSSTAVIFAMTLVFKPWGRVRRTRRAAR